MDTPGERLRWARKKAGYDSASEAARARGWPVSTYLGHENGDRRPTVAAAKRYARAFRVRWEWILEGEGTPEGATIQIPVLGHVGAGAEIIPFEGTQKGAALEEIDAPPGAPANAVAVVVRGDSMYPRYFEGERLFYLPEHRPPADLIGRECVVRLKDGRMLIKILRRGSRKGAFNLESWNAPLLEDQAVEWAAPVRWRG